MEERLAAVRGEIKTASDQRSASQRELRTLEQRLVAAVRGEVRTVDARLEESTGELRQLEQRKKSSVREVDAMQAELCGFRARLSEMEVGIRRLMGTQVASGSAQACPFERGSQGSTSSVSREQAQEPRIQTPNPSNPVSNNPVSNNPVPNNPAPNSNSQVTLSNGYRITYLGMTPGNGTSTWRYRMEELPVAQDLRRLSIQ